MSLLSPRGRDQERRPASRGDATLACGTQRPRSCKRPVRAPQIRALSLCLPPSLRPRTHTERQSENNASKFAAAVGLATRASRPPQSTTSRRDTRTQEGWRASESRSASASRSGDGDGARTRQLASELIDSFARSLARYFVRSARCCRSLPLGATEWERAAAAAAARSYRVEQLALFAALCVSVCVSVCIGSLAMPHIQ